MSTFLSPERKVTKESFRTSSVGDKLLAHSLKFLLATLDEKFLTLISRQVCIGALAMCEGNAEIQDTNFFRTHFSTRRLFCPSGLGFLRSKKSEGKIGVSESLE